MSGDINHANICVRDGSFGDIDRQAAELSGYDQSYRQMSKGRFSGTFSSLMLTAKDGVHVERVNQVIEQAAAVPRGQVAAIFLLSGQALCRLGNLDFALGDMALFGEGAEIQFSNALDTVVCVVSLSLDRLAARLPAAGQRLQNGQSLLVRPGQSPIPAIASAAAHLIPTLKDRPEFTIAPYADHLRLRFEEEVLSILSGPPTCGLDASKSPPPRQVFAQARRIAQANLDRDLPISRLAREVGVSRRALEYAFHEEVGFGPAHYIQRLRLNAVRQALARREGLIGDVTARFGIWHLSRFAAQYRDLFGELPSETLRRAENR
ncbi:helix-turn-helix domain-containing protein [Rhizobium sp. FY34]|uniref:helix-turn-helix domain-containing protein n=1 Tax=Rhizobium sp. FY34 TaxID=2562309 RepID=UPI0010C0F4B4|nr:helix-turn-helix domain-containing protein [Rhizobium sp. FY34]